MKTITQAAEDLFHELGFVLLYGVLAAIVLSSFINSISGIKRMLSTAYFVSSYKNRQVDMVILESMGSYKNAADGGQAAISSSDANALDRFLAEGLSREGRLGGAAVIRQEGEEGFDNLIITVGKMVDLALPGAPEDRPIYAAVSPELSEKVGTSVTINGNELYIEATVPEDITIGTLYSRTQASDTKRALFIFARDHEDAKAVGALPRQFLMKLVAVGADEEYKAELISTISKATGMHARIWTADDYLRFTGDSGTKHIKLRLVFFAVASFTLIAAMIMNLSRVIDVHEKDYLVNRLFGATGAQTFMRMLWLAVGFNLLPAVYTVIKVMLPLGWVSRENDPTKLVRAIVPYSPQKAAVMAIGLAVLFGTASAVAVLGYFRTERKYSNGIRRR